MTARALGPRVTGTYRVQLTADQPFSALAAMAPYLQRLGVSHAYLSPVLTAAPGSQHGYDVVDHSRIDERLGGLEGPGGLRAAAAQLRAHGIGLVLDIVPNHMALTVPEYLNRVVWSILRDGAQSPYRRWLDLDWAEQPVLLPFLGRRIDECLDAGEIILDPTGGPHGEPVVRYFDHVLPVRPGTEQLPLEELLAAQNYRLAYWRVAHEELNYRRFFDVDTLVGLRVEDSSVFDATHAVILRLTGDGVVDGLRVDHPDGLADPGDYLARLAAAAGDCWLIVEKILEPGEELPPWPCHGTTGYDALATVTGVFVDPAGAPVLTAAFAELAGADESWDQAADQGRRDVLTGPLVAEVDRLARVAHQVCQEELRLRDHSLRGLTEGVLELLAAMEVYRAYVTPGQDPPAAAVLVLDNACAKASAHRPERGSEIRLLRDLALGRLGRSQHKDDFCVRFQQTSGPVMAKGVEDTAAYRWFPLTSLAEVGVRPDVFGVTGSDLHAFGQHRAAAWPNSMNAMSTHDTKRSEDVRARLAALTEIAAEWVNSVRAWQSRAGDFPDRRLHWLMWQTIVGAWPIDAERLTAYLIKAAREAKSSTSWTAPDQEFEQALHGYVARVLADDVLMGSIGQTVDRVHPSFVANVLGQRALQLVLPGVPDVYSGCEMVNLRLVDPDNRTPADPHELTRTLDRATAAVPDPVTDLSAAKARLTALGLGLRRDRPELFDATASYAGVDVHGPAADHVVGAARAGQVVALATRFALRLTAAGGWKDTTVRVPAGTWTDLLTGARVGASGQGTAVSELLSDWPVALLVREGS